MNSPKPRRSGILFVLSAPSGVGKSTLTASLRKSEDVIYSVSCTTRAPRPGETHGRDYYFLSMDAFRHHITSNEFLEYAEVHGNFYGTLKSTVTASLVVGDDVRACEDPVIREAVADIFLMPPGFAELERRLRGRATEDEAQLATRLRNAAAEMEHWPCYRYTLVSGTREEDFNNFRAIMCAERSLSRRLDFSFQ